MQDTSRGVEQGTTGAILAGLTAALVGGAVWATIVILTDYEVGYVAWGIGVLVGLAMTKTTEVRGKPIAMLAAALAALGLLTGKALIIMFASKGAIAKEILADPQSMTTAAVHHMRRTNSFPDSIQKDLAALAVDDTIPDALWVRMEAAAQERTGQAAPEQRDSLAKVYASSIMTTLGPIGMLQSHLSLFDLLWFGLALSTAWRMLSTKPEEPAAAAPTPA